MAGRPLVFDTSFLVAAVVEAHAHHLRTDPWVQAVSSGKINARMGWHAAAECWAVLSRLPGTLQLAPPTVKLIVDRLLETFVPVAPIETHYRIALTRCSERGLRSGAVFDALHMAVAEAEGAEGLVTFNARDFQRLRAAHSPPVIVPPDPPGLS